MTNQEIINALTLIKDGLETNPELDMDIFHINSLWAEDIGHAIDALEEQEKNRWIPIAYHAVTDEERKKEHIPEYIVYMFDCQMPDNGEEIFVCYKNGCVDKDICYIGAEYSLDSLWDWIEDVVAWMPLPKPYKGE